VNPSGKLPFTIAKRRADYPADVLYSSTSPRPQINYTEKLLVDYRWFDAQKIEPEFEFGFGLSYSTFNYTRAIVRPVNNSSQLRFAIDTTVVNLGNRWT